MAGPDQSHHTKRDADTLNVLGIFIVVLSVPVFIGTLWADDYREAVINLLAAGTLFSVGAGFIFRGWWTLRHLD